jgi:hypothetical protein
MCARGRSSGCKRGGSKCEVAAGASGGETSLEVAALADSGDPVLAQGEAAVLLSPRHTVLAALNLGPTVTSVPRCVYTCELLVQFHFGLALFNRPKLMISQLNCY